MDHPIGTFNDAEITDHGFGESGEKKTPHLWVIFKTEHGELQGYFYLTERSAEFTMEKLVHMGLPAGSAIMYSDPVTLSKAMKGRQPA